jgi:hypothetical protein
MTLKPIYLVSLNKTPERAAFLVGQLLNSLRSDHGIIHVANSSSQYFFWAFFLSGVATTATNINFYKALHGLKDLLEALVYPPGILVTSLANAGINS